HRAVGGEAEPRAHGRAAARGRRARSPVRLAGRGRSGTLRAHAPPSVFVFGLAFFDFGFGLAFDVALPEAGACAGSGSASPGSGSASAACGSAGVTAWA